jgi:hypothetical protein
MSKFKIFCEVSGGTSGYRCGYLKKNGNALVFNTQDEADNAAKDLNTAMNGKYAVATFRYTVKDFLTGDELLATHTYKGQEALDLN